MINTIETVFKIRVRNFMVLTIRMIAVSSKKYKNIFQLFEQEEGHW